jgi:predicted ArsR family transcriptional regulator
VTASDGLDARLTRLSALGEAHRRALYAVVARERGAISRDEAAAAVGISRALAAYHLDRLVDDGLLEVRFERRTGRRGPGAGRPAKLYQRSADGLELSVPARDYGFVAELLATAVERDASGAARSALSDVANEAGATAVTSTSRTESNRTDGLADLRQTLGERGYEPYDDDGELRLRNCPYHRLAEDHRDLVCTANLAFISGMAEHLGVDQALQLRLDRKPGECCVSIAQGSRGVGSS